MTNLYQTLCAWGPADVSQSYLFPTLRVGIPLCPRSLQGRRETVQPMSASKCVLVSRFVCRSAPHFYRPCLPPRQLRAFPNLPPATSPPTKPGEGAFSPEPLVYGFCGSGGVRLAPDSVVACVGFGLRYVVGKKKGYFQSNSFIIFSRLLPLGR